MDCAANRCDATSGPTVNSTPPSVLSRKGKTIFHVLRSYVMPTAAALGTGALLGLIGPAALKWDNPFAAALSLIFSVGWPWAGYAFLVGFFSRSKTMSGLLAFAGLATGVTVYYLFKYIYPYTPPGSTNVTGVSFSSGIVVWGTMALLLGPPMGLAGYLSRHQGMVALPFQLAVPLIAFFETNMRLDVETDPGDYVALITWNTVKYGAVAISLFLTWRAAWSFWQRRSHLSTRNDA
ncbi:hypothetical protein ACFWG7_32200 [Streptomyces koyangensis]|uniref:hypothetical protein n=1 Tax=Streptomyces koyangensis TaxID=188770 RepID=UPI003652C541|nr:hypothetical protein OH717_10440 [Streptomyces albidoflavus]